jgi:hypothetical protein
MGADGAHAVLILTAVRLRFRASLLERTGSPKPISRWIKMLWIFDGRRKSAESPRYQLSAGCIINMSGFRFWLGTPIWDELFGRDNDSVALVSVMAIATGVATPVAINR